MRAFPFAVGLLIGALLSISAAAESKATATEKITIAQLDQTLAAAHDKADGDIAQRLSTCELTERLSMARLAQLIAVLPGEKSRQALLLLADKSAFLEVPASDIPGDPTPDSATTRQMLVQIVNYVNTTLRQLPNLIASRETTAFEDRPQEDQLQSTGVVSLSYLPLHFVGKSSAIVTFRDRKEVVDEGSGKQRQGNVGGMIVNGEFGPILSTVVADALKGKITWARWEKGAAGHLAVFHYAVPSDKSFYRVQFCCFVNGYNTTTGQSEMQLFDERSAYHGEITFNPADGSILRMTLEAEMPPKGLVPSAGIAIDYGPVEIAGKSYIGPIRSVSQLTAHTAQPHGMYSQALYEGPTKTFLNNAVYDQYRRFGSETRILAGAAEPAQ